MLVALSLLGLMAGCESTGRRLSGTMRVAGEAMKPVTESRYWGKCVHEELFPLKFSGALDGTAIVTQSVSSEGSCSSATSAPVQNRHTTGTFVGNVDGRAGAFDFVMDTQLYDGGTLNGQLTTLPGSGVGELAGYDLSLALEGRANDSGVAYGGVVRSASSESGRLPDVGMILGPAVAPRLAPRLAPGVSASFTPREQAMGPNTSLANASPANASLANPSVANESLAGSPLDAASMADVEERVRELLQDGQVPGMAMAVLMDGKIVYLKTFGVLQSGGEQRVMPTTNFGLASVVKSVTSLAIMQLVQQGKIDLDAPVTEYLPYFRLADRRYTEITIRHLLSHTSGLPATVDVPFTPVAQSIWEQRGELEQYVRGLTNTYLYFDPGAAWAYSSVGYDILGDVIAKVSGMSFEEYVREKIFVPLGMIDTVFNAEDVAPGQLAAPTVVDSAGKVMVSAPAPYRHIRTPSSYLFSNLADMARLVAADMNGGSLDGVSILDPAAYELMWNPIATTTFTYPTASQYGLGWMIADYNGRRLVSHFGIQPGYNAFIGILPEEKIGLIILSNFADGRGRIVDDPALAIALPMLNMLTTMPIAQR